MSDSSRSVIPAKPTKVWNPVFIRLLVINMTTQIARFMMKIMIPKLTNSLGASSSVVGVVTSTFAITALGLRILAGPATMTFSRKKIMVFSSALTAMAFFLYGLANSIPMIVVARLLQGCGIAFSGATSLALASDTLPNDKLGTGIGIFSIGQAVANALGPSIGLGLYTVIGYQMTFFVGAALIVIATIMLLNLTIAETCAKQSFTISLNNIIAEKAMIPMLLILFLTISFNGISTFLVLFAESRNVNNIGLFFSVYAITLLISRPVFALLSDRVGVRRILLPAMILFASSMVIISISTTLLMFLIAAVVAAVGFGTCKPAIQILCMKSVSPERRGVGSSTNSIGLDLAGLVGPMLAGAIAQSFGYANMFLLLVIPIGIAITILGTFYRRIKEIETLQNLDNEDQQSEANSSESAASEL